MAPSAIASTHLRVVQSVACMCDFFVPFVSEVCYLLLFLRINSDICKVVLCKHLCHYHSAAVIATWVAAVSAHCGGLCPEALPQFHSCGCYCQFLWRRGIERHDEHGRMLHIFVHQYVHIGMWCMYVCMCMVCVYKCVCMYVCMKGNWHRTAWFSGSTSASAYPDTALPNSIALDNIDKSFSTCSRQCERSELPHSCMPRSM